ncbi:MAG: arginine deiminase-related protein [Candidatus Eisenbacteria bacterium]
MKIAVTRQVGPNIGQGERTHLEREPIDVETAAKEHQEYEECLADLGCEVHSLAAEPDLPDSVFVEDCAVVLDELAIVTRPGAKSRRPETSAVADALAQYRGLARIVGPGTLDGGDVIVIGNDMYVGLSRRTNMAGVKQMDALVEPLGYNVTPVPVEACLHLKSAVGRIAPRTLLINRNWVRGEVFREVDLVDIDPEEPQAAGALLVGETVVYPARFTRTRARLERAGIKVAPLRLSELAKAEAGVTCCSLVFESKQTQRMNVVLMDSTDD